MEAQIVGFVFLIEKIATICQLLMIIWMHQLKCQDQGFIIFKTNLESSTIGKDWAKFKI